MSNPERRLIATVEAQPEESSYEDIIKALLAARPGAPLHEDSKPAARPTRLGFFQGRIALPEEWPDGKESDAFCRPEKE